MKNVVELKNSPCVLSSAACVGKTEGEGPLKDYFDVCYPDDGINQTSWENAESQLLHDAIDTAVNKASLENNNPDIIFAGDLLNQCTSSTYAVRSFNVPFAGLFGACSTMAFSIAMASVFVDGGYVKSAAAATSSHFCSAEKQFRYPLEYGGQRAPSAQRTVTGAASFIIGEKKRNSVFIPRVLFGKVVDFGITDTSNMGAAMAPAAGESIAQFLKETNTKPEDYDLILTGDLGAVGSRLLIDYLKERKNTDISSVHDDCGLLIYDMDTQDVHSGGSGCGCSGVVTASYIMKKMQEKEYKKVLLVGTGALMSPLISLQGESIPAIAHIVEFNR
ncbi:MAG: stage V sporulation protein AD [Clostridia bacterium]|nr:stage V sporulation protein AD [Clostridia bacterium]